jgi:colicin import membrane protein
MLETTMIHSALRIGHAARAARQRQQSATRHRHHRHQERPEEPKLGPFNIWEQGPDSGNYAPARWVTRFSSAEERNAYLADKRARKIAEEQRIAEAYRRRDEEYARWHAERQAAEQRAQAEQERRVAEAARRRAEQEAAEAAENEAAAAAGEGCLGRTCRRVGRWWKTLKGNNKQNAGRRNTRRRRMSRRH